MNRRSFLIGSSSLLTTAYLAKADWFLTNKKSVVPLFTSTWNSTKLFLVDGNMEYYEWRLGDLDFGFEDLTYRQALERYRGCYLPEDEPISLSEYRDIYHEYGIMPKMLDQEADPMFYKEDWPTVMPTVQRRTTTFMVWIYSQVKTKKVYGLVILLFWRTRILQVITLA